MKIPEIASSGHMDTLQNCDGRYVCPMQDGKALGPLVPYAGEYKADDGTWKKYVGHVYANFAKAEIWSHILRHFASNLGVKLCEANAYHNVDVFCGAPLGGYSLADALGLDRSSVRIIKAEKKVIELETPTSRETSKVVFGRHNVGTDDDVVIVEDVCNNFSTTSRLIGQIVDRGARVVAIACFLNRSMTVDDIFTPEILTRASGQPQDLSHLHIPVISLVRQPIPEYRQDDPMVADDIASDNIVWDVKKGWPRLMQAMADHVQG